ncbi:MAG TPA: response regulator [Actinomycetota bacterium]|nr:response regulator [Actinomycetota bacterium]
MEGAGSSERGASVLVVEDDPFISRLLVLELRSEGYDVRAAADGEEALAAALERCPDLVLADVMMPRMDGFELVRRLRADPRTEGVSIILLTARGISADRLEGLTAGADDYLVKPFEVQEVLARVRGALRRARYLSDRSPLTGLPGNVRIEEEIQGRIDRGEPFALLYMDLDHFKSFSDRYGFVRGDEALRETGRLIRDAVRDVAGPAAFVGHIGGDDFVAVVAPEHAVPLAREVIARFDRLAPTLYDPEDRGRGYVEAEDRQGEVRRFPLLAISIGIATTERRSFSHRAEAVAVATELRNHAKRLPGSSFELDRRGG